MTETWPYWFLFGLGVIYAIAVFLLSYGSSDRLRRAKFFILMYVYTATAAVAGGLALGLMDTNRNDGVHVIWGNWAVYAATHGPVVVAVMLSVSTQAIDWWVGGLLGTGSALFLLFGALTPSQNGGNAYDALSLWTALSALCVGGIGLLLGGVALGFKRLIPWPADDSARTKQGHASVYGTIGMLAFSLCTVLLLATYSILFAVGPDGYRTYTSQWEQIWLTIALADGLLKFIYLPVVFYFFNPDGVLDVGNTALRALAPVAPLQSINSPIRAETDPLVAPMRP